MSVDTKMKIGFGFIIPYETYARMVTTAEDNDQLDKIENEFYYLNCYNDKSDIFLGEIFYSTEDPVAVSLSECIPANFDPTAFARKYEEILDICGVSIDEEWIQPKFFSILTIT